jgi:hypothetical protein
MMKILLQSIQGLDGSQWYSFFHLDVQLKCCEEILFYNFSLFALDLLLGLSVVRFVYPASYSVTHVLFTLFYGHRHMGIMND